MRSPGTSKIVYRVVLSWGVRYLGRVAFEEAGNSDGRGTREVTKALRCRRRLGRSMWLECDMREAAEYGGPPAQNVAPFGRLGLKAIWRPPGESWVEVLFKAGARAAERSSLCGWRAGAGKAKWKFECGGFHYRAKRSMYFYEREFAGSSSIKSLKGKGLGWYLYLRLEPPDGPRQMSFMGATELKLRVVLDRDSPAPRATFGLQLVWR
jgi:hypothetical protein